MKKISVIIPMYNSERFIRQCLTSVQGQTITDLEIIVVDDGSADGGPGICKEMGLTDSRILFCSKENGGVSSARNYGLLKAGGEYVFFLDSDDAIHPRLLEEMLYQVEKEKASLAFAGYKKLTGEEMEEALRKPLCRRERVKGKTAKGREAESWFHGIYVNELSGIGGKLIKREDIGTLCFDENLTNGEDTFFLYCFIRRQIKMVYVEKDWYYYRVHKRSATHSQKTAEGKHYFECSRRICKKEFEKGNYDFALTWERFFALQIEKNYTALKGIKDKEGIKNIRKTALKERKHPMFSRLVLSERILFDLCFFCHPVYGLVNSLIPWLLKLKEAVMMKKNHADIGIITFHCSNNYGAMLQAYGLRSFLSKNGKRADIVRYEPFYMTGRHWWIPYAPIKGLKGRIWGLFHMWNGFLIHLKAKEEFRGQRANMNYFRFKYLVDKRRHRILTEKGLQSLNYKYYIVGSDQIWNPDITCGLRKAYFGAFANKHKEKVIAYAASFGGAELSACHDRRFAGLIAHIDALSVREEAAIPYVQKLCGRKVEAVLDPVFFLKKESWQTVERMPKRVEKGGYIFLYVTEKNKGMSDYAARLSQKTGLPVIEVRAGQQGTDNGFLVDYTTGPAEFLGYIHHAEYVVSNSFHAAAFSIIFEKQFLAFVHSNLGARVRNILKIHGLSERLCEEDRISDIERPINWESVRQKTGENVKTSGEFLLKNLEA